MIQPQIIPLHIYGYYCVNFCSFLLRIFLPPSVVQSVLFIPTHNISYTGYRQKMGIGNNWGLIFNQSKEEIIYTFHGESVPGHGNLSQSQTLSAQCQYHVRPGRITMTGLKHVDFDKVKYISIRKSNGDVVINKMKVNDYQGLRLKIRDDFSVKPMTKHESGQIKQFADGIYVKEGNCISCKNYSDKVQYKDGIQCRHCREQYKELWVCRQLPQKHSQCNDCYLVRQMQLEGRNKNLQLKLDD